MSTETPRSPDYARSRAILIGVSAYADKAFRPLLAAANSLDGLHQVLMDPALCGWPAEQITLIPNPADVAGLVRTLRRLARDTADVLLVYFVGHGIILQNGHLCLPLTGTDEGDPDVTGLEYERLRQALLDSPARVKVVILDCCYSGRAVQALSAEGVADSAGIRGAYTLTASDHTAHVPPLGRQANACTSFTGELLNLVRTGLPDGPKWLTLDLLYPHLRHRLHSRGLPEPNQRGTDTAGRLVFTRNPASQSQASSSSRPADPPPGESSRAALTSRARTGWRTAVTATATFAVITAGLLLWWLLASRGPQTAGSAGGTPTAPSASTAPIHAIGWTYTTGDFIISSPTVADGIVYIGSSDDKVHALDAATGRVSWTYTTGGHVYSSPAVADGMVYVGSRDKKVHALDAATGRVRWTHATRGEVNSNLAVAGGMVYVGSRDGKVYALDGATGRVRWTRPTGGAVDSGPAVADGIVYIGSNDDKVYALDAATGRVRWTRPTGGAVNSSPTVAKGVVYVGSGDGKVYALNAATGQVYWTRPTGGAVLSSPAVTEGVVYVGGGDGKVYALDAATARVRWTYATGDKIDSRPAVANGMVYIGGHDDKLHALDATTGKVRWSRTTLGDISWSSPVVVDGLVYFGSTDGKVYALDAATGRL
ncbi:PQQ-binding-like beta-propeller repeat protein [Nonomuraea sp. NEAU-A123]|uniref:caspase, EACC1-associated type n=1 Tax=Nonomuraea sp. NEAU-A123 TaxID=2839649 RepID=UPI001BE46EC0|nr:PQQ-binding-like beta-propeller repeat protein [Nonomuraea sp. NEAU-A123]MBT2231159.1 PQQ-binding-like beta-propeller repeat protein [Nonomuraea sp. NEAU-A123]